MVDETEPIWVHESWWIKAFVTFSVLFFSAAASLAASDPVRLLWEAIIFLLFAVLGLYTLANEIFSAIEADYQRITLRIFWRVYQMAWADVRVIDTDGGSYILHGEDKRLSFNLSTAGKGKQEFLLLFQQLTAERDIPVMQLPKSSIRFLRQRNTRIK